MNEVLLKKYFNIFCIVELFSCFLLFCVGMPLKYGYEITGPMFPIGLFHGLAFMGYIILAFFVRKLYKWDDEDFVFIILFGFIPFATWLVHKKTEKFERENNPDYRK